MYSVSFVAKSAPCICIWWYVHKFGVGSLEYKYVRIDEDNLRAPSSVYSLTMYVISLILILNLTLQITV